MAVFLRNEKKVAKKGSPGRKLEKSELKGLAETKVNEILDLMKKSLMIQISFKEENSSRNEERIIGL